MTYSLVKYSISKTVTRIVFFRASNYFESDDSDTNNDKYDEDIVDSLINTSIETNNFSLEIRKAHGVKNGRFHYKRSEIAKSEKIRKSRYVYADGCLIRAKHKHFLEKNKVDFDHFCSENDKLFKDVICKELGITVTDSFCVLDNTVLDTSFLY